MAGLGAAPPPRMGGRGGAVPREIEDRVLDRPPRRGEIPTLLGLWERLGTEPNRGVLLYDGLIWSAISDEKGAAKLVGISPTSGKAVVRLPLDSKATQAPVEVAGRIFLRTRRSVYCFAPQSKPQSPHVAATDSPTATAAAPANVDEPAAEPLVSKASAPSPAASADEPPPLPGKKSEVDADLTPQPLGQRPGWLGYRDRAIGFRIQLPRTWSLERKRIRRMGGSRAVVPFARQKEITARKFYLGTLQVLTWEAAGRDADGLWRSVYVQRKKLNPDVQVSRVHRVRNVGGKGLSGVVASYNFSGPGGQQVTLRSLCVVSHGVAFEVRAWAGPIRPRRTWKDIGEIFSSFQPEK